MKNSVLLRPLKEADAALMYEWVKDPEVTRFFTFAVNQMTMDSMRQFIAESRSTDRHLHLAIADSENDEYYGTISLKNIDCQAGSAEYAIVLRRKAQGRGYAYQATRDILTYAFNTLALNRVYLNVLADNEKAVKFYEKMGFIYEGEFFNHLFIDNKIHTLKWFRLMSDEYEKIVGDTDDIN